MLQNLNGQVDPMSSLLFRLPPPHLQDKLMGHRALANAESLGKTQNGLSVCAVNASNT